MLGIVRNKERIHAPGPYHMFFFFFKADDTLYPGIRNRRSERIDQQCWIGNGRAWRFSRIGKRKKPGESSSLEGNSYKPIHHWWARLQPTCTCDPGMMSICWALSRGDRTIVLKELTMKVFRSGETFWCCKCGMSSNRKPWRRWNACFWPAGGLDIGKPKQTLLAIGIFGYPPAIISAVARLAA